MLVRKIGRELSHLPRRPADCDFHQNHVGISALVFMLVVTAPKLSVREKSKRVDLTFSGSPFESGGCTGLVACGDGSRGCLAVAR